MAQMIKNLLEMLEIGVLFLGWEDPLEQGMATHSSNLAHKNSWTEELACYSPWGHMTKHRYRQIHSSMVSCCGIQKYS